MITYIDRVAIGSALPSIREEFGVGLGAAGLVTFSFRLGYSIFQIPSAWLGDKIGPRRALALIVTWWSIITALTAATWNLTSMLICRFLFGAGEAGAFPIATRSLSRWMLPSERGFAQSVTHAGSRLGATITPTLVVWMILSYGWRVPFVAFGVVGLVWAAVWFFWYRDTPQEHSGTNAAELALIESALGSSRSGRTKKVPWRLILSQRSVWLLSAMYACYGWAIAIYLDWFPSYLNDGRGLDLKKMGFYASLPLLAATLGDLAGGWLSDWLAEHRKDLRLARRNVGVAGFLLAALAIVPAVLTDDVPTCIWLTCIGVFGLEATVGVSWAIPLDIGKDYAGSVSAVMNTFGNTMGAFSTLIVGFVAARYGWDKPFLIAAGFCALASVLFWRIDASRQIEFAEEVVNA